MPHAQLVGEVRPAARRAAVAVDRPQPAQRLLQERRPAASARTRAPAAERLQHVPDQPHVVVERQPADHHRLLGLAEGASGSSRSLCRMLPCVTITPLGSAVEPEVYWRKAGDSGATSGRTQSSASRGSISSRAIQTAPASSGTRSARASRRAASPALVRANRGARVAGDGTQARLVPGLFPVDAGRIAGNRDRSRVEAARARRSASFGQSLTEMEVRGHFFGFCSLTIVVLDRDARRLDGASPNVSKPLPGTTEHSTEESYNLTNAWPRGRAPQCGSQPAPHPAPEHQYRGLELSSRFTLASARAVISVGASAWPSSRPITRRSSFWNLHHDDVGHALVLGATGSGKSFLLNFIITHAQSYRPHHRHLRPRRELRQGHRAPRRQCVAHGFGEPRLYDQPVLPRTHRGAPALPRGVCAGCCCSPAASIGSPCRTTAICTRRLRTSTRSTRRNGGCSRSPTSCRGRSRSTCTRWVQGGPYDTLFDNAEDTLTFQRIQRLDFEGLDKYPLLLEPLLFYVLHRASASIGEAAPHRSSSCLCWMKRGALRKTGRSRPTSRKR